LIGLRDPERAAAERSLRLVDSPQVMSTPEGIRQLDCVANGFGFLRDLARASRIARGRFNAREK
jgi:hypothetical protein